MVNWFRENTMNRDARGSNIDSEGRTFALVLMYLLTELIAALIFI